MRIGLLGGTFDPIHLGHLRTALEVGEAFGLSRVYLIPAGVPPHKTGEPVSAFQDRVAMTRAAIQGAELLDVLDLEGSRPGRSYSVETLKELRTHFGEEADLHFLIGVDAFLEIRTWKDYRSLFGLARFIVNERPGFEMGRIPPLLESLGLVPTREAGRFSGTSGASVALFAPTRLEISSRRIREAVAGGASIRYLVPEPVREYIEDRGLYRKR